MLRLTNRNYYSKKANQAYFSCSQVKDFMKCEAYALAKINGDWVEEPTPAMLIGSYVDSYFEGTLDKFKENNPEIYKKDGSLKADFVLAEKLIDTIEKDELFMLCLSGAKQKIFTGEIAGVPFKGKLDSYLKNEAIVDLKCIKKIREVFFKRTGRESFIENYQYDLQLAIYQELVRQKTGKTLDCIIAAVDKQEVPDKECILIPNDQLAFQLTKLKEVIPHYNDVKTGKVEATRCGVCDYCRATKKLTRLVLPDELVIY